MINNSQILLKKTNLEFKLKNNTSLVNPSLTVQQWTPAKQTAARRNFTKERLYR